MILGTQQIEERERLLLGTTAILPYIPKWIWVISSWGPVVVCIHVAWLTMDDEWEKLGYGRVYATFVAWFIALPLSFSLNLSMVGLLCVPMLAI